MADSIIDEMARAIATHERACCAEHTEEWARAAAAVVAKRIRDELDGRVTDAGLWEYLEQLAAELEGGA